MSVRRDKRNGRWFYRKRVVLPDGKRVPIYGYPSLNTKLEAERSLRARVQKLFNDYHSPPVQKKEVPTFHDWFTGRYETEWMIGTGKKPGTIAENKRVFRNRLDQAFGHLLLDGISDELIAQYRAGLVKEKLRPKSINNILNILSKPLRYAADVRLIDRAPRIGLLKTERPEIVCWSFDEYPLVVSAAEVEGPEWRVAALLAGDGDLRVGEIRALRIDALDLVAGTMTVSQQSRHGVTGTPKGGTRRTIPLTPALWAALSEHTKKRTGFVIANKDGAPKSDAQTGRAIERIYARAKTDAKARSVEIKDRNGGWHLLRHTFGTHAAMFGVNPWTLMTWMGHKRMEETMLYVHFAEAHRRPIPPVILAAGAGEQDPNRRVLAMLGARARCCIVARDVEEKEKAA